MSPHPRITHTNDHVEQLSPRYSAALGATFGTGVRPSGLLGPARTDMVPTDRACAMTDRASPEGPSWCTCHIEAAVSTPGLCRITNEYIVHWSYPPNRAILNKISLWRVRLTHCVITDTYSNIPMFRNHGSRLWSLSTKTRLWTTPVNLDHERPVRDCGKTPPLWTTADNESGYILYRFLIPFLQSANSTLLISV